MTGVSGVSLMSTAEQLKHHKLADAAQQFEGMFLQQMLKPLSEMGKEDDSEMSGGSGTYGSMGVEAVSKAIAAAGGLGIARNIVSSVEREAKQKL